MMFTKIFTDLRNRTHVLLLGGLCVVGAFAVGVETAGDVQPIAPIGAKFIVESGDVDGNGVVNLKDIERILEIIQEYAIPSPQELKADPNGDGRFTIDDALSILHTISDP
jgi:hypothetical protein